MYKNFEKGNINNQLRSIWKQLRKTNWTQRELLKEEKVEKNRNNFSLYPFSRIYLARSRSINRSVSSAFLPALIELLYLRIKRTLIKLLVTPRYVFVCKDAIVFLSFKIRKRASQSVDNNSHTAVDTLSSINESVGDEWASWMKRREKRWKV